MTSRPKGSDARPPTWVRRLLRATLPAGPVGTAVLGDLEQEFQARVRRGDAGAARRWFVRQGVGVAFWATADRVRGRGWSRDGRSPGTGAGGPGGGTFSGLPGELAVSVRALLRSRGYAAAVVLTLALALGSTLTVFTVVRGVLLRDLPFPEPDRIVRIDRVYEGLPRDGSVSWPDFVDWQDGSSSFASMAFWMGNDGTYAQDGVAEIWEGVAASSELFDVIGVSPLRGTVPQDEWNVPGAELIALSHRLWQERFGADPDLVGRTIDFHGRTLRVVAVLDPDFTFPAADVDHFVPLLDTSFRTRRGAGFGRVVARLADGRTVEAARAELLPLVERIDTETGEWDEGVAIRPFHEVEVAGVRRVLWVLMAAVLAVLGVAVANVAGLAMARVESRRSELAVRTSLGAGRGRVFRMLVGEQLLLALAGGALGGFLAWLGVPALLATAPAELPRTEAVRLDPVVLFLGVSLAFVAGMVSGLLPAVRGVRTRVSELRSGERGGSPSGGARVVHAGLTVIQIAGAVMLLTAGGLLTHSFRQLTAVDPGFRAVEVLTVELGLPRGPYGEPELVLDAHDRLFQAVQAIPGVVRVGHSTHLPFTTSTISVTTTPEGEVRRDGSDRLLSLEVVNGDYLAAVGLDPIAGQALPVDRDGPLRLTVINEAAAERFFPGMDPVGRAISFQPEVGEEPTAESLIRIVGVVPDVRRGGLDEPTSPTAYFALADFHRYFGFVSGRFGFLTIETEGIDPYSIVPGVRAAVAELDPRLPLISVATLEDRVRETVLAERFRTFVLGGFALMAVALALLGVYGVTSYGVRRSLRDVGVRMALGAPASRVRREVLMVAARTAGVGVLLGLGGAWAIGPVLSSLLFGVEPRSPLFLAGVAALAGSACVLAAWQPAARASRTDPARVLRGE
ncbi:MAG: ADOP family duplicated permease [Longimicrobiales bacterium]